MSKKNRMSVQFPVGLERAIRTSAAERGLPICTFFTILAERGYRATEGDDLRGQLHDLTVALERLQQPEQAAVVSRQGAASFPAPVLKILADISANSQWAAANPGKARDPGKVDGAAGVILRQLAAELGREGR